MGFLLTICLTVPGICQTNHTDGMQMVDFPIIEWEQPVERWRPLVAAEFPTAEVETALCIIQHESRGDPDADNPESSARGLFQVLGSLWASHYGVSPEELYDPATNTRIAHDIWNRYGWSAWSPYQRGSCQLEDTIAPGPRTTRALWCLLDEADIGGLGSDASGCATAGRDVRR